MPKLGVNIDHIATIRQARREVFPDPVDAALVCERAGCDSIVCHLREDRRHIQDKDLVRLRKSVKTKLNLEMAVAPEIVDIACSVRPDMVTLVPERRQEVTTEGGIDVIRKAKAISAAVKRFSARGIPVSLFVDPVKDALKASKDTGADMIELHTGAYARACARGAGQKELRRIAECTEYAGSLGLVVNSGHGLDYKNVGDVARIKNMNELNIGYAIIAYAVFYGLDKAVRQMKRLIR